MTRPILDDFLNDEFFKNELTLITRKTTYLEGRAVTGIDESQIIEAIIQPATTKELINMGKVNMLIK